MNHVVTQGIVLNRLNYGEADRIVSMLTPDQGKITLIVKGARKVKSKLAAGVELFGVSDISYIPGKGDMHTLTSSRLKTYWANIVKDLPRTMLGYELLKRLNQATEAGVEAEYFDLLATTLATLDGDLPTDLLELWFDAQLLKIGGHQPNLQTDASGQKLSADQRYAFDVENMTLTPAPRGSLTPDHIKFLRLVFGLGEPSQLAQVTDAAKVSAKCAQLVTTMRRHHIRS